LTVALPIVAPAACEEQLCLILLYHAKI
jgi:hypothetical protein